MSQPVVRDNILQEEINNDDSSDELEEQDEQDKHYEVVSDTSESVTKGYQIEISVKTANELYYMAGREEPERTSEIVVIPSPTILTTKYSLSDHNWGKV